MQHRKRRNKGRKRKTPVLTMVLGIAALLLVILNVFLVMSMLNTDISVETQQEQEISAGIQQEQGISAETQQEQKITEPAPASELSNTERAKDTQEEISEGAPASEKTAGEEPETSAETEIENKKETETESKIKTETESKTEPETETETETESETENQSAIPIQIETEIETESETEEKLVVAIDPGHQGSWIDMSALEPNGPGSSEMKAKASTGTAGNYSGVPEYELNLQISLQLREELEQRGYEVVLTREDNDTAISNAERALLAYEEGGDIYVRIHANSSTDSSVDGALAMVPSPSNPYVGDLAEDSLLLGQCILDHYCSKASFRSCGVQYYDNMTGINWSRLPVMILEMGFMSNESDDLRMQDPEVQEKMVQGIADGIDDYFIQKGQKQLIPDEKATEKMNALSGRMEEEILLPVRERGEEWAVGVRDLKTGAETFVNGSLPMKSASIIKVFIMAAVYDRICYPSSEERYIPCTESYEGELRDLISNMITVSDNTAANTLIRILGEGDSQSGMSVVNQFCKENGYTSTVLGREFLAENPSGDNYTSVSDCLHLLESIYSGTCVNAQASEKMYQFLKEQTRTGKIPAGISGIGALTANKTGELYGEYGDFVENDIAIVTSDETSYVLCVMTQKLQDNGEAIRRINSLSSMVYEMLS